MIRLETFGETELISEVAELLDGSDGVSHVRVNEAVRSGHSIAIASVLPTAADDLLTALHRLGVPPEAISLTRPEVVGRLAGARAEAGLVWEDVLGAAWLHSRPVATYLAFMLVAGVIAGYGVLERNGILVVGAMAVSPDLLPITAVAVAIVGRRGRLAMTALMTLLVGLAITTGVAALLAWLLEWLSLAPSKFNLDDTVIGTLTSVSDETIVVALVAGIAGMLALETRASSGVGVAISVTTIPAAAYLGVALGLGGGDSAWGALAVLAVNVTMLILGASATVAVQRRLKERRERRARAAAAIDSTGG